jgi:uncharacterized protein (TIGR03435 family)
MHPKMDVRRCGDDRDGVVRNNKVHSAGTGRGQAYTDEGDGEGSRPGLGGRSERMDGPAEWGTSSRHVEALKNASMADLALILQFHVDRPVVDQTGLKGRYDFKLQWTLDDAQTAAPDAPPELFTAIQEQIGLKMERVTSPADVLVIDKVERPGAN